MADKVAASRDWRLERRRAAGVGLETHPSLTTLIAAAEGGEKSAADALFSALYSELRRLARYELAQARGPDER